MSEYLVSIVHCWILTLTFGMESTFFHLSAEKIQWLDMEWRQAGARSPQFPGDNIQHSQPYYFPLLIMSLSSSRSPRSPRTSVHNCCDVSVPQSERQVKCPNHVSCHRFSPNELLIIFQVRWWRMSEVSPGFSWLHQPQPLLQISVREAPWSVGGWQALSSGTLEEYLNIPSSPHYLTLVTNLGSITFYADKAIIPMLQYAVQ